MACTLYSVTVCSGCWAPAMSQAPQYKPPLMLSAYKIGQTPRCHGPLQALRNLLSPTQAAQAVPSSSTQSNGSTPICHSSSLGPNPPLKMGCLRVCGTAGSEVDSAAPSRKKKMSPNCCVMTEWQVLQCPLQSELSAFLYLFFFFY